MIDFGKEIEAKFRVDDNISSRLESLNLKPSEETDEYSTSKDMLDRRIFLRFRKKNGKIFLETKYVTHGGKDVSIYEANEIETEITSEQYEKIREMFDVIFPISLKIRKIRAKGEYKGCELCHDKVDELGEFLEIEGPKDKILEVCKEFNIDVERQSDKQEGYVFMMLRKKGLI